MTHPLKKTALKRARRYNKQKAGSLWDHDDLPSPWSEYGPSETGFARYTWDFQAKHDLATDGMLGPGTLEKIREVHPPEPEPEPIDTSVEFEIQRITPTPGGGDGWDGPLSICDDHIWHAKRDPDLSEDRARPREAMVCCVAHTTGYGAGVKRLDKRFGSDMEKIDEAYAHRLATTLKYKGHFFIGRAGGLWHLAPLRFRTYHSSSSYQNHYDQRGWHRRKKVWKRGRAVKVDVSFWKGRYPDLSSPLELPGFKKGPGGKRNINYHSWAFDLLAPRPKQDYTQAQYQRAAQLIWYVHTTYNIPLDRHHVVGHEDINPFDRSNRFGPWDPGPRWDWDYVFAIIEQL